MSPFHGSIFGRVVPQVRTMSPLRGSICGRVVPQVRIMSPLRGSKKGRIGCQDRTVLPLHGTNKARRAEIILKTKRSIIQKPRSGDIIFLEKNIQKGITFSD